MRFFFLILASLSLVSAIAVQKDIQKVEWRTQLGEQILSGSQVDLEWRGGSGKNYEVYYVVDSPEVSQRQRIDIITTSAQSVKFRVPKISVYPAGTTLIFVVKDTDTFSSNSRRGAVWFDTTRSVEIADKSTWKK